MIKITRELVLQGLTEDLDELARTIHQARETEEQREESSWEPSEETIKRYSRLLVYAWALFRDADPRMFPPYLERPSQAKLIELDCYVAQIKRLVESDVTPRA